MRKIEVGDTIVLISNVECFDTPFFAKIGSRYTVEDVLEDHLMPNGIGIKVSNHGGNSIIIDKSLVVHAKDWQDIKNTIIHDFANFGGF